MITRSYDVIVAGFRPGALLAGALCAKRGMRVLVVDDAGLKTSRHGAYAFPSHAWPFVGFDDPLLLSSALDELTVHPTARKAIHRLSPSFQVVLPRHRIDVSADFERYCNEIKREFREPWSPIEQLLEGLKEESAQFALSWQTRRSFPPRPSLLQRIGFGGAKDKALFNSQVPTLGDYLDMSEVSPLFKVFLLAQVASFGYHLDPVDVPAPAAAHLLTSARAGMYEDAASPHPVQALLLGRIKDLRGDIYPELACQSLKVSWGKVTEVGLAGDTGTIDCDYFIWGRDYNTLMELLPQAQRKRYNPRSEHLNPRCRRFSLQLVVAEEGVPEGMCHHVISVLEPEAPLQDGNLITVSTSPVGETRYCPSGLRTMTVSTQVDVGAFDTLGEVSPEIHQKMMDHLRTFVPFLDRHLREEFVDDSVDAESSFSWSSNQVTQFVPRDLGPGPRLPHWNLFTCGRDAYPLLGFEGEIGAGVLAVDSIVATSGK